ncbi:MAG: aspartate kinase [Anaerostipes sp.]|nr:aspartate kinase [Anaerostipes sp.]
MLIVKKFGGTSVGNKERILNVAKRCIEDYEKGNDVVVVLSAMGKMTDDLIKMAKDINPNPSKREMDMLLTTGEQTSVALMAMAMNALGVPAVSLNAFQVAMHTTHAYSNARIKRIDTDRVNNELEQRKIVIITGFQGVDRNENYTTLGRGGSDTTAVALAAALNADSCEIYTDVDGVYTADPRKVENAKKLKEITYDEMLEMATLGAGVLHNRSVELAKKHGVQLVVRSSLTKEEGTVVKERVARGKSEISGVAGDDDAARIAILGLEDTPGVAFKVFNVLAKKNVNIDIILQSVGEPGKKDISFTVKQEDADLAVNTLRDYMSEDDYRDIDVTTNVAKVSIVGRGLKDHAGMAARMFEALYEAGVNIRMISTSEIRVTVIVEEKDMVKAMNAAHDAFEL